MNALRCLAAAGLCLGLVTPLLAQEPPAQLPRFGVDQDGASVLGVSSGGYMATQLAVAWPERFAGLGVAAAGPWACARGSLGLALGQCMTTRRGMPDPAELQTRYREYRQRELVGDPEALSELRVFIWHGAEDETVVPSLGRALAEQFRDWLASPDDQLVFMESEEAGHGWPLAARPGTPVDALADCRSGGGTHLLACDLDIAGEMLDWLHGDQVPPEPGKPKGELVRFDQSDFDARGLGDTGYLFVPAGCEDGGCELTMALHGCAMDVEQIDQAFVRYSGLNEWAATNRRVVLYPQAETSLPNPQGCWDWWGFAESTWQLDPLHDSRQGSQTGALMAMVERLQQSPDEK
ncbi:prolyl oligopeptidase family serine peptidase [Halomonas rhizosphaerae]|uniref:Prolyl oligopeptidase family serine peptidase n=1 Tax=Halomonas rhizosphaerae TaxID=3043296 RepID=A0ABT6UVQ9_9GAMM|nr:prolyl oligopeptidase family serine peptidase [Halomonas rhizosphaerae]MDI5890048.1 prolyl oligopeptidase family serine peptidase [Halomonas rhizosphaerae]